MSRISKTDRLITNELIKRGEFISDVEYDLDFLNSIKDKVICLVMAVKYNDDEGNNNVSTRFLGDVDMCYGITHALKMRIEDAIEFEGLQNE